MRNHYCAEYNDSCEGCQPTMMDPTTGTQFSADSPEMVAVRAYWKTVRLDDKKACHRIWCFDSREPHDLAIMGTIVEGIQSALKMVGMN